MFENLSFKLEDAIRSLKGKGRITDVNVADTVKKIRRVLIDADVNYSVVKSLTQDIKNEAIGTKVTRSVSPEQQFVKIVNDKLKTLMGAESRDIEIKGNPAVILVAGLQGSGKTTFCAKLANQLKKQGRQVMLSACDIYRPAAIEQLKLLGQQIEVDVFSKESEADPRNIAKEAIAKAKENHKQILIVDTAGRLSIDQKMMKEVSDLKQQTKPSETLFVVDSMTGQDAVNTAKVFNEKLDFDGVVLTKMDGDARGGAAISVNAVVKKPIKFISNGEKVDDLEVFHPDRMANRILGMGDIVSLVEKAQQSIDEQEARKITKKLKTNRYDFNDLLNQFGQLKKMGNIKELMSMVPGMSSRMRDQDIDMDNLKPLEAIIHSMTPKERSLPEIINGSRKLRIAKGSGRQVKDVNQALKQLQQMRRLAKMSKKKNFNQTLKNMFKG